MLAGNDSPSKVLHHAIVLVLPRAVVCVEVDVHLTEAMVLQKVVYAAHHCIGSFSVVTSLVCQEVDMPGESLAVDTKDCTLPWRENIDRARLKRV